MLQQQRCSFACGPTAARPACTPWQHTSGGTRSSSVRRPLQWQHAATAAPPPPAAACHIHTGRPVLPAQQPHRQLGGRSGTSAGVAGGAPTTWRAPALVAPTHAASSTSVQPLPPFINELSGEQQAAVLAPEQHTRVIAGPGSGKTRTVAARVGWLISQGVPPSSILVITFTRKAAAELRERLGAMFGEMPADLMACTFHSLCALLMRGSSKLRPWAVAEKDQQLAAIMEVLLASQGVSSAPPGGAEAGTAALDAALDPSSDAGAYFSSSQRERTDMWLRSFSFSSSSSAGSSSSKSSSSSSSSKRGTRRGSKSASSKSASRKSASSAAGDDDEATVEAARWAAAVEVAEDEAPELLQTIGQMKSFVRSTYTGDGRRKRGSDVIAELAADGMPTYGKMHERTAARLAWVYDQYHMALARLRLIDFDDMLHHTLDMLRSSPELAATLHGRYLHVLVDEGQDTNRCQFDIVRAITGPGSKLMMVGDPDQSIYGFRGAASSLMQRTFLEVFPDSAATYLLSDNYRSRPTIVRVADTIRRHARLDDDLFVPGRCIRPAAGNAAVSLLAATNQWDENDQLACELKAWRAKGYRWQDMAVLSRTRTGARMAYFAAVRAGIKAHLQVGKDFWETSEIMTAVALLRAVVYPAAAGEAVMRRLIKPTGVKLTASKGLGAAPIEALHAALRASWASQQQEDESSSAGPDNSLGACLLEGCGLGSLTSEAASQVMSAWRAAEASNDPEAATKTALMSFAPPWQQPALPGLKPLSKGQREGLAQLRGLVQLGAAAAMSQPPVEVLRLLLAASGMVPSLVKQASPDASREDAIRTAKTRLSNLANLLDQALTAGRSTILLDLLDSSGSTAAAPASQDPPPAQPPTPQPAAPQQRRRQRSTQQPAGSSSSSSGSSTTTPEELASSSTTTAAAAATSSSTDDTATQLQLFLDYCCLRGDGDETDGASRVAFMTIHTSKGKEWPCVAVSGWYEGMLPYYKCAAPEEVEQERNAAYVAVTRAKDHLLLTWPREVSIKGAGGGGMMEPVAVSRFLADVLHAATWETLPGLELRDRYEVSWAQRSSASSSS